MKTTHDIRKKLQKFNRKYTRRNSNGVIVFIVGHKRRSHFRTFKSNRYTNVKGKTIVIKEIWVGPDNSNHPGGGSRLLVGLNT